MNVTRSWLWSIRGVETMLFDTRVKELKNEVSIRHIFSRTLRFCHMSRSLLVSSMVCQDTLSLSPIDFFDQMLVCSFWGRGSWLDFFCLGLLTSATTTQCSPEGDHGHGTVTHEWGTVCDRLIALDFRKRTREKTETLKKKNGIQFRKYLSQTFSLIRLDFSSMSPKFLFFFVIPTEPSIRTHRWCAEGSAEVPGSKVLTQWTLNLRVYAHTCTQTKEI